MASRRSLGGDVDGLALPWAAVGNPSLPPYVYRRRRSHPSAESSSVPPTRSSLGSPDSAPPINPFSSPDVEADKPHSPDTDSSSSSSNHNPNIITTTTTHQDPYSPYLPHQPKSLAGIAARSFALGIALALGVLGALSLAIFTASPLWRLPFFLTSLSTFHFLEFYTTAAYNTPAAETASFLLTSNWPGYAIAHTFAAAECLVTHYLLPTSLAGALGLGPAVTVLGFGMVVLGQSVRTAAMVHAGRSFHHIVQHRRREGHVLVTRGVYAWLRHPSYFGFFWWALGTQVVMGNVVSFVGYAVVLWRFFRARIAREEEFLVGFFGREYLDYRGRVGTRIPGIP